MWNRLANNTYNIALYFALRNNMSFFFIQNYQELSFFMSRARDGTAGGKSQIVRTPLRVKHVSAGKPDWIFLARFESINGRAKTFK